MQVEADRVESANLAFKLGQLPFQALVAPGHHFGYQQTSQNAVLFGNVSLDGEASRFFTADDDSVCFDQFANVFEPDRSLVQFTIAAFGHRVQKMGRSHASRRSAAPPTGFNQIIQQQRNDLIRRNERATLVQDAESV